jgi:CheY-like chemotaxis protein
MERTHVATPILLVEDNADEIVLFRRALTLAGVTAPLAVVHDGVAAVDYLSGQGDYADRVQHPLPELLVLDLKLPRLSGLGVLEWLREQPHLRRLPVVVLTSSDEEQDVVSAYDLGANSYVVKPSGLADLQRLAELLHQYWLEANRRPPLHSPGKVA